MNVTAPALKPATYGLANDIKTEVVNLIRYMKTGNISDEKRDALVVFLGQALTESLKAIGDIEADTAYTVTLVVSDTGLVTDVAVDVYGGA